MLACLLARSGIRPVVLERRLERKRHSRAIGIHRPSLLMLERLGVVRQFLQRGVRVSGGTAESDGRVLGELRFDEVEGPFPYALSLPQSETERILEATLQQLAPRSLRRGFEVTDVRADGPASRVVVRGAKGETVSADFLVGCDGERSVVRRGAGIDFEGKSYPDSFVMGDFDDNTAFGPEARLFLSHEGLVESFPLPGKQRRWVVSTRRPVSHPDREAFAREVRTRTGCDLSGQGCTMLSAFGIHRRLATRFARDRLLLAGDAAHVVSPIGGQGLNAGWMDARDLSAALERILCEGYEPAPELERYDEKARARARTVMRRATFNTYLGRATLLDPARNALIRLALRTRIRRRMAMVFSMQGL